MRWLNPQPGEKILDVGCGDGFYTERIARNGAEATGIDIRKNLWPELVTVRPTKPCFLEMNAEELDFPETISTRL